MSNLVESGESLLLMGPPKSGKTELIRDLMRGASLKVLTINCYLFNNLVCLKNQICRSVSEAINFSTMRTNYSDILNFCLEAKSKSNYSERLVIVFENS